MDELPFEIQDILAYHETGAQFYQRVQQERVFTGFPIIDDHISLRPGVVLEVAGPAGSGKTELLLSIALHVLLAPYNDPKAWDAPASTGNHQTGQTQGWQQPVAEVPAPAPAGAGQVVVLDLDGKFDGIRLLQALQPQVDSLWREQHALRQQQHHHHSNHQQHPQHSQPAPAPPALLPPESVACEALSRLHLVRCHSSPQALAALALLQERLEGWRAAGRPCRLLLLDNAGAHYWRDRAARSAAGQPGGAAAYHAAQRTAAGQGQGAQGQGQGHQPLALSLFEVHAALAARLEWLCRRHRLPLLATKHAAVAPRLAGGGGAGAGGGQEEGEGGAAAALAAALGAGAAGGAVAAGLRLQQREYMPMPWQSAVTHRLVLYPAGPLPGPAAAAGGYGSTQTGGAAPSLTAVLAEWQGANAAAAAGRGGAGGQAHGPAAQDGGGGGAGGEGGRRLGRLLISAVAMVQDWAAG